MFFCCFWLVFFGFFTVFCSILFSNKFVFWLFLGYTILVWFYAFSRSRDLGMSGLMTSHLTFWPPEVLVLTKLKKLIVVGGGSAPSPSTTKIIKASKSGILPERRVRRGNVC